MNEEIVAKKLLAKLSAYLEVSGADAAKYFEPLQARLATFLATPAPEAKQNSKVLARICLDLSDKLSQVKANKQKASMSSEVEENFLKDMSADLAQDIPDEYFRMRMMNLLDQYKKRDPGKRIMDNKAVGGILGILWSGKSAEAEYKKVVAKIKELCGDKNASMENNLLRALEKKHDEHLGKSVKTVDVTEEKLKPREGKLDTSMKFDSKPLPDWMTLPKKKKSTVQKGKEQKARPAPTTVAHMDVTRETRTTYGATKETMKTESVVNLSKVVESERTEISEGPYKEAFRISMLNVIESLVKNIPKENQNYRELSLIVERITVSKPSESVENLYSKLYEQGKKIPSKATQEDFTESLSDNYNKYRKDSGKIAKEVAAQKTAKIAEQDARMETIRKEDEAREKYEKIERVEQEPTQSEKANTVYILQLRNLIEHEKSKPVRERDQGVLQELNEELIKAERKLVATERRKEGETLSGSLEKLKDNLDQWQKDRAQKTPLTPEIEAVEKQLQAMRDNLDVVAQNQKAVGELKLGEIERASLELEEKVLALDESEPEYGKKLDQLQNRFHNFVASVVTNRIAALSENDPLYEEKLDILEGLIASQEVPETIKEKTLVKPTPEELHAAKEKLKTWKEDAALDGIDAELDQYQRENRERKPSEDRGEVSPVDIRGLVGKQASAHAASDVEMDEIPSPSKSTSAQSDVEKLRATLARLEEWLKTSKVDERIEAEREKFNTVIDKRVGALRPEYDGIDYSFSDYKNTQDKDAVLRTIATRSELSKDEGGGPIKGRFFGAMETILPAIFLKPRMETVRNYYDAKIEGDLVKAAMSSSNEAQLDSLKNFGQEIHSAASKCLFAVGQIASKKMLVLDQIGELSKKLEKLEGPQRLASPGSPAPLSQEGLSASASPRSPQSNKRQ